MPSNYAGLVKVFGRTVGDGRALANSEFHRIRSFFGSGRAGSGGGVGGFVVKPDHFGRFEREIRQRAGVFVRIDSSRFGRASDRGVSV